MGLYNGIPFEYKGVSNVQDNFELYFKLLTNKALNLFKWENLPSTVNERFLMTQLILAGTVCWTSIDGNIYALNGNVGGEPNVYYEPTQFIIANPVVGSKTVKVRNRDGSDSIDQLEGILMGLTDMDLVNPIPMKGGLYRLIYTYSGLLADNTSSLNVSQINGRVSQIWTADNDAMARTIEEVVRDVYEGHPYRVVSQDILNKVGAVPTAQTGQSNTIINLLEVRRSILQDFYNEIGIGYQGNSKRERVNTAEIGLMKGCLDVSLSGMLRNLKDAVEKINELFGTSISVDVNEEVYYEGSGNAVLGEEELITEPENEDIISDEVEVKEDEKNDVKVIEDYEKKGENNDEEN